MQAELGTKTTGTKCYFHGSEGNGEAAVKEVELGREGAQAAENDNEMLMKKYSEENTMVEKL